MNTKLVQGQLFTSPASPFQFDVAADTSRGILGPCSAMWAAAIWQGSRSSAVPGFELVCVNSGGDAVLMMKFGVAAVDDLDRLVDHLVGLERQLASPPLTAAVPRTLSSSSSY